MKDNEQVPDAPISEYDRLKAQKDAMLVRQGLKWTNDKPTKPGWYWIELLIGGRGIGEVRNETAMDGGLICVACIAPNSVNNSRFKRWAGPIQEPKE